MMTGEVKGEPKGEEGSNEGESAPPKLGQVDRPMCSMREMGTAKGSRSREEEEGRQYRRHRT